MELKKYLQILLKNIWLLLIIILVITTATYIFTVKSPKKFTGSVTIYALFNPEKNLSPEFGYDNYYTFQSNEYLADTVLNVLKDPTAVNQIFNKANETLPAKNLQAFSNAIKATKMEPSNVLVSFTTNEAAKTQALLNSATDYVQKKVTDLKNKNLIQSYNLSVSDPLIFEEKQNLTLNLILGVVSGFILGVFAIFFANYWKNN